MLANEQQTMNTKLNDYTSQTSENMHHFIYFWQFLTLLISYS